MVYKSKRSKACAITPEVRRIVEERDTVDGVPSCIFCHFPGRGEAHVIPRSHGGLGVPENIVTCCRTCHDRMDNSQARQIYLNRAKEYLQGIYPDWDETKLIYTKWG